MFICFKDSAKLSPILGVEPVVWHCWKCGTTYSNEVLTNVLAGK